MATLNRARVCTIGTQEDMIRLCRALLDNCRWYEEQEDDRPDLTLEQLIGIITKHAKAEGGEGATFGYDMVAERTYGDAMASTCRMTIGKHATGLWTALFAYDSETRFQPEDWVQLHRQLRLLPMMAMYANDDFGLEKGMKLFAGGRVGDDWDRMGEAWLWLIAGYEEGYPPEEAVERLRKLRKTLEREDFDLTIGELLDSCIDNLTALEEELSDTAALTGAMQQYRAEKDYESLFRLYLLIVEGQLWDISHVSKHRTCLQTTHSAWCAAEGEDA